MTQANSPQADSRDVEMQSSTGDKKEQKIFLPTPERLAQLELQQSAEEIREKLQTVDGRKELFSQIEEDEEMMAFLRKQYPSFDTEEFRRQLDLVGETLEQEHRFVEDMNTPERQGLFRRAWERVKGFAKKHPVVTGVLLASLAAGGVAAGFYATGNWELLMSSLGLDKVLGGASAAEELLQPIPYTPPLPDGGIFDVPPANTPPTAPPGVNIVT